ncbi:MAG: RNA-protein complex protein Nop10 [Nanoarchaeota archaeon]|nr:RNA-protein complex protein Nop10 [Nanoarchaeota archaeon]
MTKHILYCRKCSLYTMQEKCPKCGGIALSNKPAKYSPEDKWGKYRLKYKQDQEDIAK